MRYLEKHKQVMRNNKASVTGNVNVNIAAIGNRGRSFTEEVQGRRSQAWPAGGNEQKGGMKGCRLQGNRPDAILAQVCVSVRKAS
ncbi:MAG: hypothetical protein D6820_07795 [Lentisphaerae bacterium]|nr:MAG: hypothetical protein D6820_07795 [Lentisphaerota bacterium]